MTSPGIARNIKDILTLELKALSVEVIDESGKHRLHREAKESGKGHYRVRVVSALFENKKLIERHRMIYRALEKLNDQIHALAITALTPEEHSSRES